MPAKNPTPKPPVTVRPHTRRPPTPRPQPPSIVQQVVSDAKEAARQVGSAVSTVRNRIKTIQESIAEGTR